MRDNEKYSLFKKGNSNDTYWRVADVEVTCPIKGWETIVETFRKNGVRFEDGKKYIIKNTTHPSNGATAFTYKEIIPVVTPEFDLDFF